MSYLKEKMVNLIGTEINTPFGPCKIVSVDEENVELEDLGEDRFKIPLWKFSL